MNIIVGIPVDEKDRMGIPYTLDPACTYTKEPCDECKKLLWLGGKSKEMRDRDGLAFLCPWCLIKNHGHKGIPPVRSLT